MRPHLGPLVTGRSHPHSLGIAPTRRTHAHTHPTYAGQPLRTDGFRWPFLAISCDLYFMSGAAPCIHATYMINRHHTASTHTHWSPSNVRSRTRAQLYPTSLSHASNSRVVYVTAPTAQSASSSSIGRRALQWFGAISSHTGCCSLARHFLAWADAATARGERTLGAIWRTDSSPRDLEVRAGMRGHSPGGSRRGS